MATQDMTTQDINAVSIETAMKNTDYVFASVGGALKRVLASDLAALFGSSVSQDGKTNFLVTFTLTSGNTATADKTFAETFAAYTEGKNVYFKVAIGNEHLVFMPVYFNTEAIIGSFVVQIGSDRIEQFSLAFLTDDTVELATSRIAMESSIPTELPNPNALTIKQGDTEVSYDGSGAVTVTIPESSGGTARVEKGNTDTAVELDPGKLYVFPEMTELSLTFAAPDDTTVANEYHVIFASGSTATVLTLPDTIKVPSGFSVEASKVYELSVLEGCLCAQSWAVTA